MDEEPEKPAQPSKPSAIPSWVMLGFVLGAGFVLALPGRAPKPRSEAPPVPQAGPPAAIQAAEAPKLTTIEAVFEEWGKHASWDNDLTEVALWDPRTRDFTDAYEVVKLGDALFFRSIPRLTRPVMTHGVKEGSPLLLTETEEQRREWLKERDEENWKALRRQVGKPAP
jgi:hypothetical protein